MHPFIANLQVHVLSLNLPVLCLISPYKDWSPLLIIVWLLYKHTDLFLLNVEMGGGFCAFLFHSVWQELHSSIPLRG